MDVETRLSDVLSEFARTVVTDFPIQAILDHLVVRIVDVLPVGGAGVTLISPGADPRYVAASDDSALRFERLQTELGEGPCLLAYETGESVAVADLRADDRFPTFGPAALEQGLVAVFTFPLRQGDAPLGALDLYRTTPGPLDPAELAAAQTLADVAAAYLLNAQARADLRESSARAVQTSLHDPLTGLPNRSLLLERLDHAIRRCQRSNKMVAILFADLDQFKAINDTYGHHIGDELLKAVAERLARSFRPGDTVARLGGDEFVILCEELDDAAEVGPLAARISLSLAEAFVLSDVEVQIRASVGVAFAGRGEDIAENVLQAADSAMYQAKRKGGARHGIVDLQEQRMTEYRAGLNRDLRGALSRGELAVEYQPVVSISSGQISGAETLLRWEHPTHGTVAPDMTVPLAEQSGLIAEIGRWVLEQACLDRRAWRRADGSDGLEVSVNVSAYQFMSEDFASMVADVLDATDTDPAVMSLEVTESAFVQDSARAIVVLQDLKRLGVRLALDDFGTGYSSLSYLTLFPVDILKIDRALVASAGRDPAGRLIIGAVVGLAHGLNMKVVAEGVESAEQFAHITKAGCDAFQGYHFARPVPAADFRSLLTGTKDRSSRRRRHPVFLR